MDENKLLSVVESLLFASGDPVKVSKIAKIIGIKTSEAEAAIEKLAQGYKERSGGLSIIRKEESFQMVTNSENSSTVEKMVKHEIEGSLSSAALEVVSIIAYKGPISKPDIESIRGVNCAYTLRNLLIRGLIERRSNPKDARGYVYEISFDFLRKLGVDSVKNIPDYDRLSVDERAQSIINSEE